MRYRSFVDDLAARISSGALAPGTRLPPQREFAYDHGIAYSTAARVYAELTRMGLVAGEVGRGTFVRDVQLPTEILAEPRAARVDLEYNFPVLPAQTAALADVLRRLEAKASLLPGRIEGTSELRELTASFVARGNWKPAADRVRFAGNGRQAIAAAFAALLHPGERLGVEPLTYPVAKGVAARLGVELVPIAVDEQGIVPEELIQSVSSKRVRALYVQPDFQNPLGLLMPAQRRRALAEVINELELPTIEDGIYAFLGDERPIASWAQDQVILIDSVSKRVSPAIGLGYAIAPLHFLSKIAQALRTGPWGPSGLSLAVGRLWMSRADARRFDHMKRDDARVRQDLARKILAEFDVQGDVRAYHMWLHLPDPWRAHDFAAAAANNGIAVTPGGAFSASNGYAPTAVRIALSAPPLPLLQEALLRLASLLKSGPIYRED